MAEHSPRTTDIQPPTNRVVMSLVDTLSNHSERYIDTKERRSLPIELASEREVNSVVEREDRENEMRTKVAEVYVDALKTLGQDITLERIKKGNIVLSEIKTPSDAEINRLIKEYSAELVNHDDELAQRKARAYSEILTALGRGDIACQLENTYRHF